METASEPEAHDPGSAEARLDAVLAAIPDLWFVFDADGTYLQCSDPNHAWLVHPFEQMRGRRMADLLDPELAAQGETAIRAALASGTLQRFEYDLRCRDGVERIFEARVVPMPGRRALYLTRDLTELRQLEREVLLMQQALDADAAVPIVVCDAMRPGLPAVYVNRAFERLTGWPRAEMLGRTLQLLQCEATEPEALAQLRDGIAAGRACQVALTNRRRDGTTFVNQMHLAPVHDADGRLTQYIGVLEDATERLRDAQRLQYSEELHRSLAAAIGDGLIVVNADGGIVTANPAAAALLGVDPAGLIGGGLRRHGLRLLHEDGRHVTDAEHPARRVMRGAPGIADAVYRLQRPGGDQRVVSLNVQPLRPQPQGRPVSCVVTFRDITQARLAEQALRDKQAAELANRAKSDFLSRVSHEMRTPLNALMGFAQLLQLDAAAADASKVAEYTSHMLRSGTHLLGLINQLLDLQRVEQGQLALEPEPVDFDDALRDTLGLLEPMAREHRVELRPRPAPGVRLYADVQRLRQVLMNLVSNAIKYNRPGGWVELSCEPVDGGRCRIHVSDAGIGMSAAQQQRLFQPFERLGQEASAIEGSGLGLVIARSLVEAMGGRLTLSSRPGAGTQVTLELPSATAASSASSERALPGPPPPAPPLSTAAPLRMLYVEDNRINALLLDETLKLHGNVELRIAEDGSAANALLAGWTPQVLVLDAHLPDVDGFELLRRLRRLPGLAETPAFMCSADAMPEDLQRARDAGFAGYWTKPIDIAAILADLAALVR